MTTLPPSCAVVTKSGNPNFLEPSGPRQSCNGTDLRFYYLIWDKIYSVGPNVKEPCNFNNSVQIKLATYSYNMKSVNHNEVLIDVYRTAIKALLVIGYTSKQ